MHAAARMHMSYTDSGARSRCLFSGSGFRYRPHGIRFQNTHGKDFQSLAIVWEIEPFVRLMCTPVAGLKQMLVARHASKSETECIGQFSCVCTAAHDIWLPGFRL